MKKFEKMLETYAAHHTKKINKLLHFIGVPIIFLAIQIFLSNFSLTLFFLSLPWLMLITLISYYLLLNTYLGIITAAFLTLITYLAHIITVYDNSVSNVLVLILFIIGWIILFIGHYFEGKSPAFLENILQIFIAPMFLVSELGIRYRL